MTPSGWSDVRTDRWTWHFRFRLWITTFWILGLTGVVLWTFRLLDLVKLIENLFPISDRGGYRYGTAGHNQLFFRTGNYRNRYRPDCIKPWHSWIKWVGSVSGSGFLNRSMTIWWSVDTRWSLFGVKDFRSNTRHTLNVCFQIFRVSSLSRL